MTLAEIDLKEFCDFLIEAKKKGYAGHLERIESDEEGFKEYRYQKGNYLYRDKYYGKYLDVGQEIVWWNNVPLWGMGYRGGIFKEHQEKTEDAFIFLRKALIMPDKDFPIRGPKKGIIEGDYEYINIPTGNITKFNGIESLEYKGEKIYHRDYLGGLIFGRLNPQMKIIGRIDYDGKC